MMQEVLLDSGKLKWAEQAEIGYFAQDHGGEFVEQISLFDWMKQWTKGDQQLVRSALGRMLFSNDDVNKNLPVLSGGEKARMLFGKFSLINPNVLIMDEPTNHLDMESIEALNLALENYPGTLIFVSHDREFVSSLATRIVDMQPSGLIDFKGNYEDYLRSQGIY
jgi:ATPase subunit of ABC transporter with duplicated ATPase domains